MKKRLAFALIAQAVSIAILITLSLQFFRQLKSYSDYTSQVEHTYLVINQLEQTEILLKDAETSSRGYIITRDKSFLGPLDKAKSEIFVSLDSLRYLISDNGEEKAIYKKLEKVVYNKMLEQVENAHNISKYSQDSLVKRMQFGHALMTEFMDEISDMRANELALLSTRKFNKDRFEARLPEQVRVVFLIAGLSTLIFGLWIFIELRKRFKFQGILQQKVWELRQNNEELEQVAFAASHDLQEPLRKIRIFSDRLLLKIKNNGLDEDSVTMAQRMNHSAARMQALINDLINFNKLVQSGDKEVLLQVVLDKPIADAKTLSEASNNIHASLEIKQELPVVKAVPAQIEILFNEIFKNAYQFRLLERPLQLVISCEKLKGKKIEAIPVESSANYYYHISIADNGSGFDETYKEKMFQPFQRLQNYSNDGESRNKGMGLAICKRIMLNHAGWIDAEGKPNQGTTIHLYFPV